MKRNILRSGRSSLVISLPKSFVDENNLKIGEEIDVEQHGSTLMIRCETSNPKIKRIELSELTNVEEIERILDKILGILFKQGFDTFQIKCSSKDIAATIRKIIRNGKLNMYEESSIEESNILEIHSSISLFDTNVLDNIPNVIIKQIYRTLDELEDHLNKGTFTKAIAKDFYLRDKLINEQSDICRRMINRNVLNYKSTALYNFVDKWEKIGDTLKNLCMCLSEKNNSKKYVPSIRKIKEIVYLVYNANKNFSIKKLDEFYKLTEHIEDEIKKVDDKIIYHYQMQIFTQIQDSYSDVISQNI